MTDPRKMISEDVHVKSEPLSPSNSSSDGDVTSLSHQEAMAKVKVQLAEIISNDPLLHDLPTEITLEEINSQIALEYGQAMTVNVRKMDSTVMPVVVVQNATVLDLKRAIQRYITLKLSRDGQSLPISWKHVWRSYWLYFEGQKLTDDKKPLKEYDIHNRDEVTFIKRLNQK